MLRRRSVVSKEDLKAGKEMLCDYGFLEQYRQGEEMFKTILDVGQAFSKKGDADFHVEMKNTVQYLKQKVDQYKPYMDILKTVYNMMSR